MNEPSAALPDLVLVDGSSYLYRAYHAMPDLRVDRNDPASPPTGAIRGMINMLQSLRKDYPSRMAVCVFDASGPTFRDQLYPEYKAHRSPMPDDLRAQIEPIHEVIRLLGWPLLAVQGIEADDVIGTLAKTASAAGLNVLISSGDKDLSQLVTEQIVMVDTMNGKRRDVAGVEAEFGVPPKLMVDFQTLVGDAVDNVPGVEKVGPKTAAKWLQTYGSLEGLLAHADDIKGVAGENLRKARDWLPTGRQLVTILTNADLSAHVPNWPDLHELHMDEPNVEALDAFYASKGFQSLLRKRVEASASSTGAKLASGHEKALGLGQSDLFAAVDGPPPVAPVREQVYETILDESAFLKWMAKIRAAALTAVDTETTSLDGMQARLVGISLSVQPGEAAYVPLAHDYPGAPVQLSLECVLQHLKPWLEDPNTAKVGQHVKYDMHVWANHGVDVKGMVHDTLLQSYVLEAHKPHALDSLAARHLGRQGMAYEDLCGKGVNQIPISQVEIDRVAIYACEDADMCLEVHQTLWPRIQSDHKLAHIYQIEMGCTRVLFEMERTGVLIDARTLQTQSQLLGQRIVELEQRAHELAGQPFNLSSPKQIGEIFFTQLGLPIIKKTASGAPSTDEEVLEKLAEDYPLPATILEHRGLAKLKSTYTDKLSTLIQPSTGRVHTHYAQAVAVTGRLSSSDPNLQNIPIRTPEGRKVREAFVAGPGNLIASADYSQIELRIMAHLSEDPALLAAFERGDDVHRATASEIFAIDPAEVTSDQRRTAKVINFGLIYGMSAFGLARNLGIENAAAKLYMERYFDRYPGVRAYMDRTREQAKAQGYVETVFGRRLFLPEIRSPNGPRRAAAERAAINAPMQGTAADLIKLAMIAVQRVLHERDDRVRMIMQVHDELVFELPAAEEGWVRAEVPRIMAEVAQLRVPLLAEVGVGPNWEQAHG